MWQNITRKSKFKIKICCFFRSFYNHFQLKMYYSKKFKLILTKIISFVARELKLHFPQGLYVIEMFLFSAICQLPTNLSINKRVEMKGCLTSRAYHRSDIRYKACNAPSEIGSRQADKKRLRLHMQSVSYVLNGKCSSALSKNFILPSRTSQTYTLEKSDAKNNLFCRYFAVLRPMSLTVVDKRGKIMLITAWIGSIVCSLPQVNTL